jgi:TATA-binding protein-associated factor Taf7
MNAIGTVYVPPGKRDSISLSEHTNRINNQTVEHKKHAGRPAHLVPTKVTAPKKPKKGSEGRRKLDRQSTAGSGSNNHGHGGDGSGTDEDDQNPHESHLILRMPAGHPSTLVLREKVQRREAMDGVRLCFDSHGAVETRNGFMELPGYSRMRATLVDLPCVLEAHKTFDQKQVYKVADIAQMIVVDPIQIDNPDSNYGPLDTKIAISWPDGITPPLRRVRQRRFRKRMVNTSAELIEAAVENLLRADFMAEETVCEMVEFGANGRKIKVESADPVRGGKKGLQSSAPSEENTIANPINSQEASKASDVERAVVDNSKDMRPAEKSKLARLPSHDLENWDAGELAGLLDKDLESQGGQVRNC